MHLYLENEHWLAYVVAVNFICDYNSFHLLKAYNATKWQLKFPEKVFHFQHIELFSQNRKICTKRHVYMLQQTHRSDDSELLGELLGVFLGELYANY